MIVNTQMAFAVRCDVCGRLNVNNLSLFEIPKNGKMELDCICGQSNAIIKTSDYKSYWLEIPCFACQDIHVFKYTLKQLLKGKAVARCIETGTEICFIGQEKDVELLANEYEEESKELINQLGFYDYFENFEIMMECLNKIKELEEEEKILCECGSNKIEIDLYQDRLELKCLQCDSLQMIYAETEEDLQHLLNKDKIIMHKHSFQCIDAINQNSDSSNTKKQI